MAKLDATYTAITVLRAFAHDQADAVLEAKFHHGRGEPYYLNEEKDRLRPELQQLTCGDRKLVLSALGEDETTVEVWRAISDAFVEEGNSDWRFKGSVQGAAEVLWGNSTVARGAPTPKESCEVTAPCSRILERVAIEREFFDELLNSATASKDLAGAILDGKTGNHALQDLAWRKTMISAGYAANPITPEEFATIYSNRKGTSVGAITLEQDVAYYTRSKAKHVGADGALSPESAADANRLMAAWEGMPRDEVRSWLARNLEFHKIHKPLLEPLLEQRFGSAGAAEPDEIPEMH